MNRRIDTHHHALPDGYRALLLQSLPEMSGNLPVPQWSSSASLEAMAHLDVETAILSVSAPGTTFVPKATDAAALARDLNDELAGVVAGEPDRFGFFATVPMPHLPESVGEAERALDELHADGVILLANASGTYLGQSGQDELWSALDRRGAVVFIHPNQLPGAPVDGVPPFATDFLLDTSRAAYLLVRNGIRQKYGNIRFILSHGGGFVPYAAHRLAWTISLEVGRDPADVLEELSGFYFDTALTSSPSSLPSLLGFAQPGHVTFGSDYPYAPWQLGQKFGSALDDYLSTSNAPDEIDRAAAQRLFPRLDVVNAVDHRSGETASR